jgi:flagellar hook protein FlgE
MPFNSALSGLNAASADLRVTANNIANSATTGFKQSRAEFADVFATAYSGISRTAIGSGVRLAAVTQQFTQGNIAFTGNNLDMALSGKGFFVLDDNGSQSFSRDGAFQIDRDGYVVSATGKRLLSYPVQDPIAGTFNRGSMQALRLTTTESAPQATSAVEAVFNLRSDAPDLSGVPFDATDPGTYGFTTSMTVYDSLGRSHVGSLFFRNVGPLSWESYLTIDGTAVGGASPLTFGSNGQLTAPTAPVNFGSFAPTNGAAPMDIAFDFTAATQYGSTDSITSLSQDGFASGRLTGVDISAEGIVLARYTNGQSQPLGLIAVANFANPQGLQPQGENAWAESYAAGDPVFGAAAEGDFGSIQSGGLENSNVDIAAQLVNLITAQRNFQANAQVISTADDVTQTIINIR